MGREEEEEESEDEGDSFLSLTFDQSLELLQNLLASGCLLDGKEGVVVSSKSVYVFATSFAFLLSASEIDWNVFCFIISTVSPIRWIRIPGRKKCCTLSIALICSFR